MKKLNFHIEQADNGILIADRTDCKPTDQPMFVEIAYDKDIPYILGKSIWSEIRTLQEKELATSLKVEISLTPIKSKL